MKVNSMDVRKAMLDKMSGMIDAGFSEPGVMDTIYPLFDGWREAVSNDDVRSMLLEENKGIFRFTCGYGQREAVERLSAEIEEDWMMHTPWSERRAVRGIAKDTKRHIRTIEKGFDVLSSVPGETLDDRIRGYLPDFNKFSGSKFMRELVATGVAYRLLEYNHDVIAEGGLDHAKELTNLLDLKLAARGRALKMATRQSASLMGVLAGQIYGSKGL